ncbi:MAG: hypothetical protein KAQ92_06705, partial [Candidatus Aenigmarchaeota archaeon]|nr:hypothetical protein [Candidatus Aenigmarchaeota archaeon]
MRNAKKKLQFVFSTTIFLFFVFFLFIGIALENSSFYSNTDNEHSVDLNDFSSECTQYHTVYLSLPENNSYTVQNNNTLAFNFNHSGALTGIVNCTLLIDAVAVNYTTNISSNTNTIRYSNQSISESQHWWWVNCTNGTVSESSVDEGYNYTFTLDTTNPYVNLYSPTNTTYDSTNIALNYYSSDTDLDKTWYQYNNANTTLTVNTSFTALDNQQSTIIIWANDTAGNINSTAVTFTVDTSKPYVHLYAPTNTTYDSTTISLTYYSSDPHLDKTWYQYNSVN